MIRAVTLVAGRGRGAVAAIAPLSFWGGYDPVSGIVIDRHHPACGQSLRGRILAMRSGRGSSSSSSVLAEAIRLGTSPAGIVLCEPDPIIATGAMVAAILYRLACPVVLLSPEDWQEVAGAAEAEIQATTVGEHDATVRVAVQADA